MYFRDEHAAKKLIAIAIYASQAFADHLADRVRDIGKQAIEWFWRGMGFSAKIFMRRYFTREAALDEAEAIDSIRMHGHLQKRVSILSPSKPVGGRPYSKSPH